MDSPKDFSGLLDDSMELTEGAGPAQVLSSSKFSTTTRDAADDAPGSLTSPYRSTTAKWLSGGSVSGLISCRERASVFFGAKATLTNESPTGTLGARQNKETSDTGLVNKDDQGANGPTPQLSSPIDIVSAVATVITQNIAHPAAANAPRSPSTGSSDSGLPVSAARQTVPSQNIAGDAASDMYPAKSAAETTAFAIALTPAGAVESGTLARDPAAAGPSNDQGQASTIGKPTVPEQPAGVFSDTFAADDSDSEFSVDRSTRSALPDSFTSIQAGSQNNPGSLSTAMSSQSAEAMDRTRLRSEGLIGVASPSADQSISDLINSSPMSSSKVIQPMESHEMHVSGAPKTDLTVRIEGDAGQSVNLRVVERAGQIQVSVRTNDPVTAAMLRREIPALQTGLERIGWHANPIAHATQPPNEARSSEDQAHSHDQNAEEKSQNNPQQQQQRPRSSAADQWLELMHREN
jgi:hypothetical protein